MRKKLRPILQWLRNSGTKNHEVVSAQLGREIPRFSLLFLPIFLEQLFGMLVGNVDVLMLSQYSDQAVAAVGMANQLMMVAMMVLGIVSLGSAIILMQIVIAEEEAKIGTVIHHGMWLGLLVSFVMALLFISGGKTFLSWIQTPKELIDQAYIYLSIVSLSLIFQSVITSIGTCMKAFTLVKFTMVVSILTNLLNIFGNYLVLMTPFSLFGKGILGVSISTMVARTIGMIIILLGLVHFLPDYFPWLRKVFIHKPTVRKILGLGFPSALENISYTLSQMVITGIIASFGYIVVTSKIYTQNITAIIFTMAAAVSQANQIIVGRLIGSHRKMTAKHYTEALLMKSVGLAFVASIVIAAATQWIVPILTDNPAIQALVIKLVWWSILLEPARMVNEILLGALNSAGDVKFPTRASIMVTYCFTVPMSFIIGILLGFGILGVWVVFIFDEGIRAGIMYWRWRQDQWQAINIMEVGESN